MKVAILNYEGVVPTSVSGPYDMLTSVASVSHALNVPCHTFFDVHIVDTSATVSKKASNVVGNRTLETEERYDLVIVPAMSFDRIEETMKNETEAIDWVRRQYENGSDVASICMGAFLLGSTGVLNGKKATTHWMAVPFFRQLFPLVKLEDNKVIVDEGKIYTTGAAYSFTSLMIYLVEKWCGRDMAMAMDKVFMIQVHNTPQGAFSIFNLQHNHKDENIKKVQLYIEKNFGRKLLVSSLAEECNMSQRTFIRKFTNATGNTPLEYLQRVRIESAKRMLEKGKLTIEEISSSSGYEDFNSFRIVFRKYTGLSPLEYRRKYNSMFSKAVVG